MKPTLDVFPFGSRGALPRPHLHSSIRALGYLGEGLGTPKDGGRWCQAKSILRPVGLSEPP